MTAAARFFAQHEEIVSLVQDLAKHMNLAAIQNEPALVRKKLSAMAGKLVMHLAIEDKALYPRLLESDDAVVVKTAKSFMETMGGLKEAFETYNNKWRNPSDIADQAGHFIEETQGIIKALGERVNKENKELYPLL